MTTHPTTKLSGAQRRALATATWDASFAATGRANGPCPLHGASSVGVLPTKGRRAAPCERCRAWRVVAHVADVTATPLDQVAVLPLDQVITNDTIVTARMAWLAEAKADRARHGTFRSVRPSKDAKCSRKHAWAGLAFGFADAVQEETWSGAAGKRIARILTGRDGGTGEAWRFRRDLAITFGATGSRALVATEATVGLASHAGLLTVDRETRAMRVLGPLVYEHALGMAPVSVSGTPAQDVATEARRSSLVASRREDDAERAMLDTSATQALAWEATRQTAREHAVATAYVARHMHALHMLATARMR